VDSFGFTLSQAKIGIPHVRRCEELLSSYLSDNDPDAVLAVGSDMRKIQCCYSLLKVSTSSVYYMVQDICMLIILPLHKVTKKERLRSFANIM